MFRVPQSRRALFPRLGSRGIEQFHVNRSRIPLHGPQVAPDGLAEPASKPALRYAQ
jgi:hypothetical protein